MNKQQLISEMSAKAEMTKLDTEKVLKAFIDTVTETLAKGDRIQLVGFGSFEVVERASRTGRNPQDGSTIVIPESKAPKFKFAKNVKDIVKNA